MGVVPEPRTGALAAQRRTITVAPNITPPDQLAARVDALGLPNVA